MTTSQAAWWQARCHVEAGSSQCMNCERYNRARERYYILSDYQLELAYQELRDKFIQSFDTAYDFRDFLISRASSSTIKPTDNVFTAKNLDVEESIGLVEEYCSRISVRSRSNSDESFHSETQSHRSGQVSSYSSDLESPFREGPSSKDIPSEPVSWATGEAEKSCDSAINPPGSSFAKDQLESHDTLGHHDIGNSKTAQTPAKSVIPPSHLECYAIEKPHGELYECPYKGTENCKRPLAASRSLFQ